MKSSYVKVPLVHIMEHHSFDSGHLVVCRVDFPFGEVIIPNGAVDLRVAQKAPHAVLFHLVC